jgi:hypothetical protein
LRAFRWLNENELPRFRQVGPLRLDLLVRDALVEDDPLGLHLRFVPETNSLAVHVSRLRAKLRIFEIAELLRTTRNGDYVLIDSKQESYSGQPAAMVKVG